MRAANAFFVRYVLLAWVGVMVLLIVPVVWMLDTAPPFSILKYVPPDPVHAGQKVVFAMPVIRDTERGCSVQFTRHLFDGANVRHDYVRGADAQVSSKPGLDSRIQFMSAEGISEMDKIMGPWLRVALIVPAGATPGKASVGTELQYRCNPLHAWFPIRVSLLFPFEILP